MDLQEKLDKSQVEALDKIEDASRNSAKRTGEKRQARSSKNNHKKSAQQGGNILSPEELAALESIEKRILWLSTNIIHYANHVRPNPDKNKIGGHQASSASVVSILTALYFYYLKSGDRVAIKPHASPAYHAVQYLLGNLPQKYLTELRSYKGLQAYPSRTKDPDPVDFSTGSVGLGAAAPTFAALGHLYARTQFGSVTSRRFVALLGDAELDEGSVWETVAEEALRGLGNVLWIVDLNRQSLDRVIPGIKALELKRKFEVSGWNVLEVKYGQKLQAMFNRPGGEALRQRIDEMSNEEYQTLLRLDGASLRSKIVRGPHAGSLEKLLADISDADLPGLIGNLGGHDLNELLAAFRQADLDTNAPTVLFVYTVKGWGLPIAGDRLNHSALLTDEQVAELRQKLGIAPEDEWAAFLADSAEGKLCQSARDRLYPATQPEPVVLPASVVPEKLDVSQGAATSSQEAFGRVLRRLADVEEVGQRIVTTSPDVSISTNLAGWINKVGVFSPYEKVDYEEGAKTVLKWTPAPSGRHIELGISEMNLFMLLGMLGLSTELSGQQLFPIGTVYDPFVCRGLDALIYGLYSHSKFIFAGTPAGITLSPEGGAHQSSVTASLGIELPYLRFYEPCYGQEVEWLMLEGLRQCCDRQNGYSTYLRLSTKVIEQAPFNEALSRHGAEELRKQVIGGGYRLVEAEESNPYKVQLVTCGAIVPETLEAARLLQAEGVAASVINMTGPGRLYQSWQEARVQGSGNYGLLEQLIPPACRKAPIITVHDASSHALSWLGSVYGARLTAIGVDDFGQSASRPDLYRHFGLSPEQIAAAAFEAVDEAYG
ncbi:MAG TPA: 1-deoxy-D-xylulose-5-phosphate synthase N-terminal domain-containing protein [Chloroflexia bacterium]|nr:1-deoxy-D-xylulose-5-phosphate synthase N-terminal domain-containing protein [Chloroflexia bacterium]